VDLDGGFLQMRRTLRRTEQGFEWGDGKTTHSRRKIALSATVVEALGRHRLRQSEERAQVGDAWEETDLVFPNEIGGRLPLNYFYGAGWFGQLLRQVGLPVMRFHDLRHTAATLLLGRGVNPKVVSEILGHSSVAITLELYGHVTPHMQRDAVATMDSVLRGGLDESEPPALRGHRR
jgi:integrase